MTHDIKKQQQTTHSTGRSFFVLRCRRGWRTDDFTPLVRETTTRNKKSSRCVMHFLLPASSSVQWQWQHRLEFVLLDDSKAGPLQLFTYNTTLQHHLKSSSKHNHFLIIDLHSGQPSISMIHNRRLSNGELMNDMPEGEVDGDGSGHRASLWELICNYVVGKAKPLIFGQLLAFWLVRTLPC